MHLDCDFNIQHQVSLKKCNTFRVGGQARYFFEPESVDELLCFLRNKSSFMPDTPCYFLGLGSNTLFPDGNLDICVIRTRKLAGLSIEGHQVTAEAGLSCAKLAKKVSALGLNDAAWFAGIPGTVGGALRMNAGAFGGVTWAHVVSVLYADLQGHVHHFSPKAFHVGYRSVSPPFAGVFLSAIFEFSKAAAELDIKHYLQMRNDSQPIGTYNCGSVFKNPEGYFSAKLIDGLGLKGYRLGGACVSKKHANFIENISGNCSSQDILQLIQYVQNEVEKAYGIVLEPEVVIVKE
ncbi:MAG: UDP-N-acetylmuramate dehydrogenase [Gammaproteobacteria bacterium]|jgi:UDP-N-acetylmuramate dehydrogenase|nr:UDP-N-acetylmuramate dehydrogenase [Gammaproteobacteria bacterium]